MRTRNRFAVFVALAATTLSTMLPAGASAAAVAAPEPATRCGIAHDSSRRLCITSSNTYPNTIGWYGYIAPSSPCSGGPFQGYWSDGLAGICSISSTDAWAWKHGAWVRTGLVEGTKGYVHPYAVGWRWLYVQDQGWVAVQSSQLSLLW
jgi:hypothetical protein